MIFKNRYLLIFLIPVIFILLSCAARLNKSEIRNIKENISIELYVENDTIKQNEEPKMKLVISNQSDQDIVIINSNYYINGKPQWESDFYFIDESKRKTEFKNKDISIGNGRSGIIKIKSKQESKLNFTHRYKMEFYNKGNFLICYDRIIWFAKSKNDFQRKLKTENIALSCETRLTVI